MLGEGIVLCRRWVLQCFLFLVRCWGCFAPCAAAFVPTVDLGLLCQVRLNCLLQFSSWNNLRKWKTFNLRAAVIRDYGAVITLWWHNCTGRRLSIGRCVLQRGWLVESQPKEQSREELSEMFKRSRQLIHSIPADEEKDDRITAVYSWWSCTECNYFKHSAAASPTRLGLGLELPTLHRADTLNLWLVGTRHSALLWVWHHWILHVHPILFFPPPDIPLAILPCFPLAVSLAVALRWLAFYVHAVLAFPYHMVILMLPFASIILFVAAWTS